MKGNTVTPEPTWKHYLTDYNEGLGLVYERFALPLLPCCGRLSIRQQG